MTTHSGESSIPRDLNSQASAWESGWYLFDDGQVKGPLSAKEAFAKSGESRSGQLVSRKGFSQWYPVGDFAEIYNMSVRFADSLAAEARPTAAKSSPVVHARNIGPESLVRQDRVQVAVVDESNIRRAQVELNKSAAVVHEAANLVARPPVSSQAPASNARASQQEIKKLTRKEKKRLVEEERRRRNFAARQAVLAKKAARNQAMIPPVTFEQQYMDVASRLRLGKIVSPFVSGFIYTPLSFGGYWWAWFVRASEEVSWHLNGASRMNFILPLWVCLIPGPNLVLAYFVARMVRQIEEQNGYRTVNPWFAAILAIFPPLYVMKIQSALNRHWRLHVFHSVRR